VRLVKGAYWDSEIKRAQLDGLSDYPVYTRKAHTDVAYLACARQLLATHDAIYPQFATHNAHTLAAVHEMAGPDSPADAYEFQCLHGMGETLYEQVVAGPAAGGLGRPCRIYAPVGTHETLLAYLVRRLLENGANTSFVNRVADESLPLQALVQDPVQTVRAAAEREGLLGAPHPAIARPADLYRRGQASASGENTGRENAAGLDLADETTLARLGPVLWATRDRVDATDGLALSDAADQGQILAVRNPADPTDIVGTVRHATADAVQAALAAAHVEFTRADGWPAWPPARRAHCLELAADALQADTEALICLLVREAGKTVANAVAEVREAVDFLRFYGQQIRQGWQVDTHRPLGPVACISPWNFPLAIFLGQVAAALAAGNTVFAKPAEQTPLVAQRAVAALHAAGVPAAALHLLPGDGPTVGAALVGDARVQAVLFTGSTEVARLLQRTLAQRLDARGRPVTLVAETGGQNALVVDSSALLEQVTQDVLVSAFDSAGQRCSALRVLCVQEDVADRLIEMIEGALRTWRVGDPRQLATDVGPVIDEEARAVIEAHIAAMRARGLRIHQPAQVDPKVLRQGHFVTPTLIEIDDLKVLTREVFGPVLNVLRYRRDELPALLEQVRATGYGLTMGVHSRIDETIAQVVQGSSAGNLYVNRTIVGAVVGVQPFGGEGLSGTGPKAGGPLYLLRLLAERPDTAARQAVEASGSPAEVPVRGLAMPENRHPALQALSDWAEARGQNALIQTLMALEAQRPRQAHATWRTLPGPTGEANLYTVTGREQVLCLADDDADRLTQLAAVLAAGGQAVWPAQCSSLYDRLPAAVRNAIVLANDWRDAHVHLDAALHHGDAASRQTLLKTLAERPGPIVALTTLNPGERRIPLERLWLERSLSINTAAAGGNASLMTLGEG
jgi:RHH-type proline utilization regulon transcriptional repressor/proline dehydrogenase/delta 1-pyrroline-5-carboxylate dehydrogenase